MPTNSTICIGNYSYLKELPCIHRKTPLSRCKFRYQNRYSQVYINPTIPAFFSIQIPTRTHSFAQVSPPPCPPVCTEAHPSHPRAFKNETNTHTQSGSR